jgi:restriction system protein
MGIRIGMHVGPLYASTSTRSRGGGGCLPVLGGLIVVWAAVWAIGVTHGVALLLIVPAGVAVGAVAANRRRGRHGGVVPVDAMTGPQFEHLVADLMARSGFRDVQVRGGRGDGGVDIVATDPQGYAVAVQCKRYAGAVGVGHVRDFLGALAYGQFAGFRGMLVTSGSLTVDALAAARVAGLAVVARPQLNGWLGQVFGVPA